MKSKVETLIDNLLGCIFYEGGGNRNHFRMSFGKARNALIEGVASIDTSAEIARRFDVATIKGVMETLRTRSCGTALSTRNLLDTLIAALDEALVIRNNGARDKLLQKLKDLGITDEEIELIKNG